MIRARLDTHELHKTRVSVKYRRKEVLGRTPCSNRPLTISGSIISFSSISLTFGPTTSVAKRATEEHVSYEREYTYWRQVERTGLPEHLLLV